MTKENDEKCILFFSSAEMKFAKNNFTNSYEA